MGSLEQQLAELDEAVGDYAADERRWSRRATRRRRRARRRPPHAWSCHGGGGELNAGEEEEHAEEAHGELDENSEPNYACDFFIIKFALRFVQLYCQLKKEKEKVQLHKPQFKFNDKKFTSMVGLYF